MPGYYSKSEPVHAGTLAADVSVRPVSRLWVQEGQEGDGREEISF